MNAPNLPAYLQNKTRVDLNTAATTGMGGVMPPHVSIRGNSFTLIDGNGAQQPVGAMMDACVIDILEVMGKKYYENDWTPGSDEPPTCWSTNGVAPSREAQSPQSQTCATCQWNVRGSDISKLSQKPIKACRDEKIVAILLPQYPGMIFQLVIPPGSFKHWSAFTKPFEKSGMDVSDVLIRFSFEPQKSGVMMFAVAADQQGNGQYMPEHLVPVFNKALASKATDALVGRNDVPIAITHQPQQAVTQPAVTVQPQRGADGQATVTTAQFGGQPQAQVPFGQGQAQPASSAGAFGQPGSGPAQPAETKSPSEQQPRRTRRTRDQIVADNAAKAAQAGTAAPQPATAPVQPQAPFPVSQPGGPGFGAAPAAPQGGFGGQPAQVPFGAPAAAMNTQQPTAAGFAGPAPQGNTQSFGIQTGADPNVDPQLAAMLATLGT